jgi:hypothetical protein
MPVNESGGPPRLPGADVQTPGTFGDANATLNRRPPVPKNFRVTVAPDGQHLLFTIADIFVGTNRRVVSNYQIWFSPISLLADASTISNPAISASVFAAASLVSTVGVSLKSGDVQMESDRQWFGKPGWFFATSVNDAGTQSLPTPAIVAPGTSTGNDSAIPADVTGAQAVLVGENVGGRSYVRVFVTAQVPQPIGSFAGYQIYLKNYRYNPLLEEGPFIGLTTQQAGQSLSGTFLLDADVPDSYAVGQILLTGLPTILDVNGVGTNWNPAWSYDRYLEFYAPAKTTSPRSGVPDGVPVLWRGPLNPGTTTPTYLLLQGIQSGGAYGNYTPGQYDYRLYAPDTQTITTATNGQAPASIFTSHEVTLFFVAVSRGGTRRADPEDSPRVVFPFGIGGALTKPLNPVDLIALTQGAPAGSRTGSAVNLIWQLVQIVSPGDTVFDSTVAHFNIYRARVGTANNPDWTVVRPNEVFTTLRYNDAMTNFGGFGWVDKNFNTDPTVPAVTANTGWDFDPTDPGQYVYWVLSVNIQGTENTTAYWGKVSTTNGNATITKTGGEPFTEDFVGQTIQLNGSDYTIETVNIGAQTATIDPVFADATGTYQYFVGPVTGRVTLVGNSGSESDPSINQNDALNRLFNTQFIGTPASALQTVNSAYGPANSAADGQPTYRYYMTSSLYQGDDTAATTGVAGVWTAPVAGAAGGYNPRLPAGGTSPTNDTFSIWEEEHTAGGAAPTFTNMGEIVINATGQSAGPPADFTYIGQLVDRGKYLIGQYMVLVVRVKIATIPTGTLGVLKFQVGRYDARNFSAGGFNPSPANGFIRDDAEASWSVSVLTTDYQPFFIKLPRLPFSNPVSDMVCNGTTTITAVHNDFNLQWVGLFVAIPGDGTHRQILTVTGGSGILDNTTITLGSATSVSGTVSGELLIDGAGTEIGFTHYITKISIVGPCNDGAGGSLVYVQQPMLNSGTMAMPWTSKLNQETWPGGTNQTGPDPNADPNKPVVGCVPPGTPVLTPNGPRAIELCLPGSVVLSYDGRGLKKNRVAKLNSLTARTMYTFTSSGHRKLVCSSTHRLALWNDNANRVKYVAADQVCLGDIAYTVEGTQVVKERVVAIESETGEPVAVYSLTMKGSPRNYFSGGWLNSNKNPRQNQD